MMIGLTLVVIACIGVGVNRQLELNSCVAQYSDCSLEVKKLTKIAGEYDTCKKDLENCRSERNQLKVLEGKYLAYKEQKGNTSLATVQNAQFLMEVMQDYKIQAAKNADRKDLCDKHLRNVEGKLYQLINNITAIVAENERCKVSWNKCVDELADIKTKTVPSSHKD